MKPLNKSLLTKGSLFQQSFFIKGTCSEVKVSGTEIPYPFLGCVYPHPISLSIQLQSHLPQPKSTFKTRLVCGLNLTSSRAGFSLSLTNPTPPEAQRFPERTHCTTEPEIGHENTLESLVICAQLHPSLCLLVQHRCSRHGQGHGEHQQASLRVPQYNVTITHKPLHPSPPSSKTISPQLPARGTPQAGSPRSHNRKPLLTSWSSYCS